MNLSEPKILQALIKWRTRLTAVYALTIQQEADVEMNHLELRPGIP